MTIWVCGEVLADLLPGGAVIGGGPANTAKALARLGQMVEFIGGISTDTYGKIAIKEFIEDGVGLRHVSRSDKPTCTAEVSLDKDHSASYRFSIEGTATFDFGDWLPDPYKFKPQLLHIGTLATIVSPGADNLVNWALSISELAPIIYDPNVRATVLADREKYLEWVEKWLEISSIVKVSDEDLRWLYPEREIAEIAQTWIGAGVTLVVITKGASGITAFYLEGAISADGVQVEVVDTVGAGDTVGAVLAEAIIEKGLENLRGETLREVLNRAAVAAAITCSRSGANPPTKKELNRTLEMRE